MSDTDVSIALGGYGAYGRRSARTSRFVRHRVLQGTINPVIEEVRSGAVIPEVGSTSFFAIEVVTASGRRKFRHALETIGVDVQSDTGAEVWESQRLRVLVRHLNTVEPWLREEVLSRAVVFKRLGTVAIRVCPPAELTDDDSLEATPEEVLMKLQDAGLRDSERCQFIVEAETLDFTGDQSASLTMLLRRFIDDRRESNVPSDLVAVASAIRKFVATAGTEEAFDYAASLLRASGRSPLPLGLELEVTKMVVRKLTANPPASSESLPDLAARLNELSETYLNPRLLAREKHGAVALNAVIGLVLTRDRVANDVIGRVHGLGVAWFQQLVGRRASRLKTELEQRSSGDRYRDLLHSLDELSATACENTST
jgi:hypothetical protein